MKPFTRYSDSDYALIKLDQFFFSFNGQHSWPEGNAAEDEVVSHKNEPESVEEVKEAVVKGG
ncbi:3574_t:CDS:2 [Dentiscutata erythropus]|uniref:3574_t:CDS:1 n=1 Tax=Dentiscutata erythropus TaxID=1348616 RepID=A0A9N9DZI8_9GLOM|nr:3574_t:CDS:2 [Dentiscutata erythropus]